MKIIGHQKTLRHFDQLVQSNKLPHALLFTGPAGVGKKLVAKYFVQKLFCSDPQAPCEKCRHCQRIAKFEHPDLFWIDPESESIKIDQIRELKKDLSLVPFEASWKIAVLVDADRLNISASNALLKTLEEPPPSSLIILTTALPHFLLKTILSRCQKIYFSPLRIQETEEVLKLNGKEFSDPRLIQAIGGSPGLALSFSENICQAVEEIFPALESNPKDLLKLLAVAEEIASQEETYKLLLQLLAIRWREKIVLDQQENDLKKFDKIQNTLKLLERNVNPLLAFENLFLNLCL